MDSRESGGLLEMAIRELTSVERAAYSAFFSLGLIENEESFRISPQDEADSPFPTKD